MDAEIAPARQELRARSDILILARCMSSMFAATSGWELWRKGWIRGKFAMIIGRACSLLAGVFEAPFVARVNWMRTFLICHESAGLDEQVLARWLHSFTDLVGLVLLQDPRSAKWHRVRREIKRVGIVRFLDVLAFRLYYRAFLAAKDRQWERQKIDEFCRELAPIPSSIPVFKTRSVNAEETAQFIARLKPDLVLARCKALLNERIFSIPTKGTFVMHPGVCPEYRNAHGCFWALAERDFAKVGMTLLKIDPGIDTGPVFGYYSYGYDEVNESHIVIQHRVVLENLKSLQNKLMEIFNDTAAPVDTTGRLSRAWGQPWLSRYLSWKANARKRGK
jgi:hypothetical protein